MEHFVRVVLEKTQGASLLDESIFPTQNLLETANGNPVIEIPLDKHLTNEEADGFADKLSNYMFESGYDNFDIEISGGDEE
jgi:hypothetical protein|tara:strand:- start:392 stop:634 length:243 start_codon:yes stop_codon:yes gene_type:complete